MMIGDVYVDIIDVYLDDERITPEGFVRTYTAPQTIELINNNTVGVLSLDHDLGGDDDEAIGTGYDVLEWIEREVHDPSSTYTLPLNIIVHSANPPAKKRMEIAIQHIYKVYEERFLHE